MDNLDRYKRILKGSHKFKEPKIKTFVPKPTDDDYLRGYITRYFVQKVNDKSSPIYEVNSDNFSKINNNTFYIGVSIKWKITQKSSFEIKTLSESNRNSIKTVLEVMPNLKLYLPNLLQFHK